MEMTKEQAKIVADDLGLTAVQGEVTKEWYVE